MNIAFKNIFPLLFAFFLAVSCEECIECENTTTIRFIFMDSTRTEVYEDNTQITLTTPNGKDFKCVREFLKKDSIYVHSFTINFDEFTSDDDKTSINLPDTLSLSYANQFQDNLYIHYQYSEDSNCCFNKLISDDITLSNHQTIKNVFRDYNYYSIKIKE